MFLPVVLLPYIAMVVFLFVLFACAGPLSSWGVPPHVIQLLGRWRSDAYWRYIQVAAAYIAEVMWQMARFPPAPPGARGLGP